MLTIGTLELPDFPLILSPMDDITDFVFRGLCREHGADVVITEFIASEALNREAEKSYRKMLFTEQQRPVGIQIFGNDADSMLRCIDIVADAQPDFIDINWGCPVRKVAGKGGGAGMLRDLPQLISITRQIVNRSPMPVTVKTRLGYDSQSICIVDLAERLQDIGVSAISVHGRTKTQMYAGRADWEMIAKVKNNPRLLIPVFGNGDLSDPASVVEAKARYGVDGVLIGRGAIGNPWIFEQSRSLLLSLSPTTVSISQRCDVCRSHAERAVAFKGERTALLEMRKHYGGYFRGLPNFKPFRQRLVTLTEVQQLWQVLNEISTFYSGCSV